MASKVSRKASANAERPSKVAGRASEPGGGPWSQLGGPQGQLGGPWNWPIVKSFNFCVFHSIQMKFGMASLAVAMEVAMKKKNIWKGCNVVNALLMRCKFSFICIMFATLQTYCEQPASLLVISYSWFIDLPDLILQIRRCLYATNAAGSWSYAVHDMPRKPRKSL